MESDEIGHIVKRELHFAPASIVVEQHRPPGQNRRVAPLAALARGCGHALQLADQLRPLRREQGQIYGQRLNWDVARCSDDLGFNLRPADRRRGI